MTFYSRLAQVALVIVCHLCVIFAEWNTKDYQKREHSLVKPYHDGRWDFIGSTLVTNNYVRLTPDHQSRKGGLWNNVPCNVRNWELHVHFKVHGSGRDLFGDGLAIWYARDRLQLGPVFGSKDYFHGLAVFLDTYSNHNGPHNHGHPYVSAMVNNGSSPYDHDRDGTHTEVAGCESQFRNVQHETYMAIRYELNKLTVSMDISGKNAWKQCFSVEGVRLPTGYFFGASSATGELADNHDIISMKLYDLGIDDEGDSLDARHIVPSADLFAPPRDHVEDQKSSSFSGWKLFFLIFLSIVGLGVCMMVGFIIYSNRSEAQRKRFY